MIRTRIGTSTAINRVESSFEDADCPCEGCSIIATKGLRVTVGPKVNPSYVGKNVLGEYVKPSTVGSLVDGVAVGLHVSVGARVAGLNEGDAVVGLVVGLRVMVGLLEEGRPVMGDTVGPNVDPVSVGDKVVLGEYVTLGASVDGLPVGLFVTVGTKVAGLNVGLLEEGLRLGFRVSVGAMVPGLEEGPEGATVGDSPPFFFFALRTRLNFFRSSATCLSAIVLGNASGDTTSSGAAFIAPHSFLRPVHSSESERKPKTRGFIAVVALCKT